MSQNQKYSGSCANDSSMQYLQITWTDNGYDFNLNMSFTTVSSSGPVVLLYGYVIFGLQVTWTLMTLKVNVV